MDYILIHICIKVLSLSKFCDKSDW